ncbi:MAG: hypothetical protein AAF402_03040 [Pseudomonadota bacterium]
MILSTSCLTLFVTFTYTHIQANEGVNVVKKVRETDENTSIKRRGVLKDFDNPSGSAKRKLIRTIAGSGGLAMGGLVASGWKKPVIESLVIPAHASTSPDTGGGPGEGTNTTNPPGDSTTNPPATTEPFCPVSFSVSGFAQEVRVALIVGGQQLGSADQGSSGFYTITGSSTFDPGTYDIDLTAVIGDSNSFNFFNSNVANVTCCDETGVVLFGEPTGFFVTTRVNGFSRLEISPQGVCSIVVLS